MIVECKGKAYSERLKITGLTDLERRRERADMLEVFKIINGHEGLVETQFFRRNNGITRGNSLKLYKERVNTDMLKFSFGNRIINKWNRLPDEVVKVTGINAFKTKLDRYLRNKGGD